MGQEAVFTRSDWALMAFVAATWGASFLFIDVGVDHFAPALVALGRLAFGAATLAAVPAARRGVDREDWPAIAALAVATLPRSTFAWSSLAAVAALGCLGTALAFVAFTRLVGRVGSTRGSVTIYFLPAVAIVLGAVFRGEAIAAIWVLGTAFVTVGAWVTSRSEPAATPLRGRAGADTHGGSSRAGRRPTSSTSGRTGSSSGRRTPTGTRRARTP